MKTTNKRNNRTKWFLIFGLLSAIPQITSGFADSTISYVDNRLTELFSNQDVYITIDELCAEIEPLQDGHTLSHLLRELVEYKDHFIDKKGMARKLKVGTIIRNFVNKGKQGLLGAWNATVEAKTIVSKLGKILNKFDDAVINTGLKMLAGDHSQ